MKQEFKLLKNIIRDYTPEEYSYEPDEGRRSAKKSDYDNVDVIPVADPNAATMSQKVVQYQAVMQMAAGNPQIYDMVELNRQMLEVLGIKNAAKLVPMDEDQRPTDPVTENQNLLKMKPVKAFLAQDHQAHIAVHMAAMQDPIIMQLIGQNPRAPQMQAAMMAHIAEHVGFAYRQKIEQQLGMPLPPEDEKLPPEVETALSGMMAQAAQQVLQQNQAQAQQQQAQQQAQDPVLQLQQQELQIRQQEAQTKQQKVQNDMQIAQKKLQQEAADLIRLTARQQGFTERSVFTVAGAHFDWGAVLAAGGSLSLFADRQIVELRIPSGKPGKEGSVALQQLAESTVGNDAVLVLVTLPRLDKTAKSSGWFMALESHGASVQLDPVERSALPACSRCSRCSARCSTASAPSIRW